MVIQHLAKVILMKQLLIKDNQYKSKSYFSEIKDVVDCIADKTLAELEKEGVFVFPSSVRESEDLTNDQMILQSYNDMYVSGNIMGFLGVENQRIVIESRFSRGDNLRNAMRKGLFKTYICKKYNDGNVRGSIDVARHIKNNTPFIGNIAYSKREYSYDNYLIELVRHTIEYIKGKNCGRMLLGTIKDEVNQIIQATPEYRAKDRRKIIDNNIKNVVRHAYYHEYRLLQQLCILILRNEQHQYGTGSRNVYGILFDGAWLWEEYVNTLIGDAFYHPKNKAGDGAQHLFAGNHGTIYPDFIGKDRENRIIADAKYKPLNNISGKDYLQVLAYMFRFDARQGFYLYPEAKGADSQSFRLNRGVTYEGKIYPREDIKVTKCGLNIPQEADNYKDFIIYMQQEEQSFKEKIFQ